MKRMAVIIPLAFIAACSDGQLGDNGLVRFSQVVNFSETQDFTSPIVLGRTVFVALQRPDGDIFGVEDPTFTELTLQIEDRDNPGEISEKATTFPLGFAQFGVLLNVETAYRLVASEKGQFLDSVTVFAQPAAGIRISKTISVVTQGLTCSDFTEIDTLEGFVLHQNQSISFAIVPETEAGEPMIGLLPLSASASPEVRLDSPLISQGSTANALSITPSSELGSLVSLSITEEETRQQIQLDIDSTKDLADPLCE